MLLKKYALPCLIAASLVTAGCESRYMAPLIVGSAAVIGTAALSGEAITGHRAEGIYHLTYEPEELRYYQKRAKALLEKAESLIDIYTEEQQTEFHRFRDAEIAQGFVDRIVELPAFRNITVHVCHDRWAVVVKERAPRVAFVIRHPKLVDAIERFAAPLVDE